MNANTASDQAPAHPQQKFIQAFINTYSRPTAGYNKTCGSYFLKNRYEQLLRTYIGMEEDFIKLLRTMGYKTNKKNQLKLLFNEKLFYEHLALKNNSSNGAEE